MRVAGLDVGERRIGVAVSDELGWTAQPVTALERTGVIGDDLDALKRCLAPFAPTRIVVGLPRNMNGSIGTSAERISAFADLVGNALEIPVVMWDERLSTVAVERVLIEADVSRAKRKKVVDKLAAAYILQGFLDSLRNQHS